MSETASPSTLPEHLRQALERPVNIFNHRHFELTAPASLPPSPPSAALFPQFKSLPKEIRLQIWTLNLEQTRYIRVLLDEPDPEPQDDVDQEALFPSSIQAPSDIIDENGNLIPQSEADLESQAPTADPPLIKITFLESPASPAAALPRVCREAWEACQRFYPLRLPALVRVPIQQGSQTRAFTAYLHPEFDIISVYTANTSWVVTHNPLPLLLHTLLQHDNSPPKSRFGVRNLCIDLLCLNLSLNNFSPPEPAILASVRLTISHLRNLYFRHVRERKHMEDRLTTGPFRGSIPRPWFNASIPVLPALGWRFSRAIERIEIADPRLAGPEATADLQHIGIRSDSIFSQNIWRHCQDVWGVEAGAALSAGVCMRILVADAGDLLSQQDIGSAHVTPCTLQTALRRERFNWLSIIDEPRSTEGLNFTRTWLRWAEKERLPSDYQGGGPHTAPEEWLLKRQPFTAVGFWLIEPEKLEAVPRFESNGVRDVDLSQTPEALQLWVFKGPY